MFFCCLRPALVAILSSNIRYRKGLANLTHPFAGDPTFPTVCYSDSSLEPTLLLVSKVRISEDVFDGSLSAREQATDSSRAGGAQMISMSREIAVGCGAKSGVQALRAFGRRGNLS